jgi:hypothetical protein
MQNFKTKFLTLLFLGCLGQALIAMEKDASSEYCEYKKLSMVSKLHKELIARLPNQPLLQGFLEDRHLYQILLINDGPSPYILIKSKAAHIYLTGIPHEEELEIILKELSNYRTILLICEEQVQSFFIKNGFTLQLRADLELFSYNKKDEKPYVKGLELF